MTRSVLERKDLVLPEELSIKEDSGVAGVEVVDDQKGIVRALVSVTGIKDRVNDIIHPGAYADTLTARTPKGLVGHDWKALVAKAREVRELMPGDENLPKTLPDGKPWPSNAGALLVEAQYNLDTPEGKTAYSNAKFFGNDQEWSIGYSVPAGSSTKGSDGIRHIKKLDLFEFSQVLWGAMPHARTQSVKADGSPDGIELKEDLVVTEVKDGGKKLSHPITMPDGSFPIQDEASLKDAIQANGRSKNIPACHRHIIHVAGLLGLSDLVPEDWKDIDPADTEKKTGAGQVPGEPLPAPVDQLSLDLAVKAFQDMARFLFLAGAISEDLATKVAGDTVEKKVHKTMFDIVDDLGAAVFDEVALAQCKNLATIYDFALEQKIDTVVEAAEGRVADFLADAIAAEADDGRVALVKEIAAAMVLLRGDGDPNDPLSVEKKGEDKKNKNDGEPHPEPELVSINLDDFKV